MLHHISFQNSRSLTLRGIVVEPKKYDTVIVYLHGFPSHIAGFTGKRLAHIIEKSNYLFFTFDFSHTDTSEGKFEDKLMSKEVEDIKYALDFLYKNYKFRQLVLYGHSTGAIDAALYAHKDKRIDKLILTGAVSDLKHAARYDFTDMQIRDFWRKGYIVYDKPDKWYHKNKLKKAFYDEFFTLNIPTAIKKYKKPLLLIHGEFDEAVPLKDAEELLKIANKPKQLVIIKGADHSFTQPMHFLKLMKVVGRFLHQ